MGNKKQLHYLYPNNNNNMEFTDIKEKEAVKSLDCLHLEWIWHLRRMISHIVGKIETEKQFSSN